MSQPQIRYTVTMQERHLWGARVRHVLVGVGSSKKENELLVFFENGGLMSINYNHVIHMVAEPLTHLHADGE